MALPPVLRDRLRLPVIGSPLFIVSGPDLVIAQCKAGIVGSFPSLNARPVSQLDEWLARITEELADHDRAHPEAPSAPFAVNQIVHKTNNRLEEDVELCAKYKVPIVITSLGAVPDVIAAVHSYGGLVFHDVINRRHAEKAAQAGADGIICVAAGAGGHAGTISPFALIAEIKAFFDGVVILSGAMNTGRDIAAARAMGADLAYLGTRFIATREAMVDQAQKDMMLEASAADIVYTPNVSGVAANFMRQSLVSVGLDPDNLPPHGGMNMDNEARAWKTVWSAGQGVGSIRDVPAAAELCQRLISEYRDAVREMAADPFAAP